MDRLALLIGETIWICISFWIVQTQNIKNSLLKNMRNVRNFNIAYLGYVQIKHSDWLLRVTWLVFTNYSGLFLHNIVRYATVKIVCDMFKERKSR